MRRLPPFPELVAFDAVARHLSFTRAAQELCLTQSAVSHRVRRLEDHLGCTLIRRLNPGLALTDAGSALLPDLKAALDALERVGAPRERRLRVVAASALCSWWLAPRLPDFMAQRPGVSIELVPRDTPDPSVVDVDLWIQWSSPAEAGPSGKQRPLAVEQVFPVCHPRLLPGGRPLRDAAALAELPLLHKAARPGGEWSWDLWFERLGVTARSKRAGSSRLAFADMGLILSAAVDGAGVALVRSLLAHDALRDGRLVPALANAQPMPSAKQHVARWPSQKSGDADIAAFVEWLAEHVDRSLADTERLLGGAPPVRLVARPAS